MEYKFLFSVVVILKKYHIISLLSIKIIIIDWRKMSMIRKVKVLGKTVEIYYKDGVDQSLASMWRNKRTENIPPEKVDKMLGRTGRERARKLDEDYIPRMHKFHDGVVVQNCFGIPEKYWNVEMHNYADECRESHYVEI